MNTFTFIVYQQILLNAYTLICDLHARTISSYYTQGYKNDSVKADFLSRLMNCYVPPDLEILLTNLVPTIDPQRKLQLCVLSFAGFVFDLGIGRCVPSSIFILASLRTNAEPETILRTFYVTTILTIHESHYTPLKLYRRIF